MLFGGVLFIYSLTCVVLLSRKCLEIYVFLSHSLMAKGRFLSDSFWESTRPPGRGSVVAFHQWDLLMISCDFWPCILEAPLRA